MNNANDDDHKNYNDEGVINVQNNDPQYIQPINLQKKKFDIMSELNKNYSITVENDSGVDYHIGLYQVNPRQEGYSLLWKIKPIGDGAEISFDWSLNYQFQLSWGGTKLEEGAVIKGKSKMIDLKPGNYNKNAVYIELRDNNSNPKRWKATKCGNKNLKNNQLSAKCSPNWNNHESKKRNLNLMLLCDENPILARPARANFEYVFNLDPTYYLCLIDEIDPTNDLGSAMTASARSQSTKVVFKNGYNELTFRITGNNQIVEK